MTEKEQKVLNLLHMARRAGKLQMGFSAVERSCFAGKALLLIAAEDLSKSSQRKLEYILNETDVTYIRFGRKALFGESFNIRDVGVICVDDRNIVKGILGVLK